MSFPVRLPDAASLAAILECLDPAGADAALVPALSASFPGFDFSLARIDDDYWRSDRDVIRPDGTQRIAEKFDGPFEYVLMPEVGHFPTREAPDMVGELLTEHFGGC